MKKKIFLIIVLAVYSIAMTILVVNRDNILRNRVRNIVEESITTPSTEDSSHIVQHIMAISKDGNYISRPITNDSIVSIIMADTNYTDVAIFTGEEGKPGKTTVLRETKYNQATKPALEHYWLVAVSNNGSVQYCTTTNPLVDTFLEDSNIIHLITCYVTDNGKVGIADLKRGDHKLRELDINSSSTDHWLISVFKNGSIEFHEVNTDLKIGSVLKDPQISHLVVCYITDDGKIGLYDLKEQNNKTKELVITNL